MTKDNQLDNPHSGAATAAPVNVRHFVARQYDILTKASSAKPQATSRRHNVAIIIMYNI